MKQTTSGMGQGLAALLGETAINDIQQEKIHMIPVEQILPNPHQPRQNFLEESLQELTVSIREQGVLLPILVRPVPGTKNQFRLVAGERRWRASKLAGLTEIPALIRNWNDRQALEASILENVQREDLNPVEIARGCQELIEKFGYSHKKAAQRLGKSREAISNFLRLLKLPETILGLLESGTLSTGHARALLRLEGQPEAMTHLAHEVIEKELSVRQTESLVRTLATQEKTETETDEKASQETDESVVETETITPSTSRGRQRDPMILSIENRLATTLKVPITITHLKGRGRIIVEYATLEELEMLSEHLMKGSH